VDDILKKEDTTRRWDSNKRRFTSNVFWKWMMKMIKKFFHEHIRDMELFLNSYNKLKLDIFYNCTFEVKKFVFIDFYLIQFLMIVWIDVYLFKILYSCCSNKLNALWFQASNVDRLLILKEGKLTKQEG
jgi:hypothetical protein